jgi:hypothetical protein
MSWLARALQPFQMVNAEDMSRQWKSLCLVARLERGHAFVNAAWWKEI